MNYNRNNKTNQKTLESMHAENGEIVGQPCCEVTIISIRNEGVCYTDNQAIHGVSLDMGQNEVIALVCTSGCENPNKEKINEVAQNPQDLKKHVRLSWSGKALEKIGDHTKNICRYVIYLVKGNDARHFYLETVNEECN